MAIKEQVEQQMDQADSEPHDVQYILNADEKHNMFARPVSVASPTRRRLRNSKGRRKQEEDVVATHDTIDEGLNVARDNRASTAMNIHCDIC